MKASSELVAKRNALVSASVEAIFSRYLNCIEQSMQDEEIFLQKGFFTVTSDVLDATEKEVEKIQYSQYNGVKDRALKRLDYILSTYGWKRIPSRGANDMPYWKIKAKNN